MPDLTAVEQTGLTTKMTNMDILAATAIRRNRGTLTTTMITWTRIKT
jgi:hypothetical protein